MPISVSLFSGFGPISDIFLLIHHLSQIFRFCSRGPFFVQDFFEFLFRKTL